MNNTTKNKTKFTGHVSPQKERKPMTGQIRKSDQEILHNADMRALEAAKNMHDRLKRHCITIRIGDLTITGLPTTVRHRLEYMGYKQQEIDELCKRH